ncbi:MAG: hypothetical protein JJ863_19405 [Deltaproteobacteria bacterium]|nr:hypothetical protein [Deltaproteobacteria bacterium]
MDFPHDAVPQRVLELCARLRDAGFRAWIVGGCVRDLLLGRAVGDWDVATSARPKQVQKTFRRVIPTGIQHGTVTVMLGDEGFEVTTLRGDGDYSDGRRPDEVTFVDDIADDLARRDFTVNAIAYEPTAKLIVDPHGGLADLEARQMRAVGEPAQRFAEDGLRILRGARFVATLGFELEPETEAAFAGALDVYEKVSPERVREEWLKAMKAERPSPAFEVMRRTGILGRTCPALGALADIDDGAGDLFARSMRALDASKGPGHERVAAALHCVGRARGAEAGAHAKTSAELVETWFADYRFSKIERREAGHAVRHHEALLALDATDDAGLRAFVSRVGRDELGLVSRLARAVAIASDGTAPEGLLAALERVADSDVPLAIGDLAVGGREVIAALGGGGRIVGDVLEALLARTLAEPSLNDAETLQAMIPEIRASLEERA